MRSKNSAAGAFSLPLLLSLVKARTKLLSESLLPELQRRTPVAVLDDVDRQSPWASGMAPIDLPDLQASRLGVRWIDLGPLPIESVSPKPLARALVVTIGFLLDS